MHSSTVLPLARVYLSYIIMSFMLYEGGRGKSSSRIELNIDTQTPLALEIFPLLRGGQHVCKSLKQ
jgi:hypothetical protein